MKYTFGDLIPAIKATRGLKLPDILKKVSRGLCRHPDDNGHQRVIRPKSMALVGKWHEDSYISTIHSADLSSEKLSKEMLALGKMNLTHAFLDEIMKVTGDIGRTLL